MKVIKYRDIVDRIDVDAFEEAIGFLPIDQKDNNDVGHCPDLWGLHKHGDRTGKFAIHRIKKVYNCWVCGGGSLLSLAMQLRDCSEQDALEWLTGFVGEHVDDDGFVSEIEAMLVRDERARNPILPWFNERLIEPWCHNISEEADWLQRRGISAEVAREWKLGYDPEANRKSRKGVYNGPAIIFPHYWSGQLVGWQSRWLSDDRPEWVPKYTNTTEFPRQYTLYGYDQTMISPDPVVVVESVPTVLFLASHGVPAVATFGSNVTPEQLELLRRFQQGVILAPDNDKPGEKFATELSGYLERFIEVRVTPVVDGEGADLGDLAEEPELLKMVLDAADYL